MPRVGSEYRENEEYSDRTLWEIRRRFLELVETKAPRVLEDLRGTVFSLHQKAERKEGRPRPHLSPVGFNLREYWQQIDRARYPYSHDLITALLAWGDDHGFRDDWLLATALRTMVRWQAGRPSRPDRPDGFALPPIGASWFRTLPFTFGHVSWNPTWEPWQEYERALRAAFDRAVRAYRDASEAEPRSRSLRPGLDKRGLDRHLDWLVRFQVQGVRYEDIAFAAHLDKSTVEKAVRAAAREVGLRLRRDRNPHRKRK